MKGLLLGGAALAALLTAVVLRRPLGALAGLVLRSGAGVVILWLLQGLTGPLGIRLGVNLLNGAVLGVLGAPGLALLLLVQWAAG